MNGNFFDKLKTRVDECDSYLCIGLDPHYKQIFTNGVIPTDEEERCDAAFTFCKTIIDATVPSAAAYKPNVAFFEALGSKLGLSTLRRVILSIPENIPILLDAKRGDIGSTAAAYADACYADDGLKADGVTLSPLMGWDSLQPFVTGKYSDRGAFLLCKTSNPGSNDILALDLHSGQTIYEKIAHLASTWSNKAREESQTNTKEPCFGLVVGATDPDALSKVRNAAGPDIWILAPGVGAQGGNLEAACRAGMNAHGNGLLLPVSREISGSARPGEKAEEIKNKINAVRSQIVASREETGSGIVGYQKDFLEFSIVQGVLKFGSFVLKSSRTSPYFFNAGLFANGSSLYKLGKAYAAAIMNSDSLNDKGNVKFDVVFGPAYKGISLGALVCAALYSDFGVDVGYAYNRKEAKDHGEGGVLVGSSMKEKRVLIVDDVITAGTAIRESHDLLTQIGGTPIGVAIALDRAEKRSLDDPVSAVQAVERDLGIPVISIVSLPQLQSFLTNHPDFGEDVLSSIVEYREQYGV